MSSGSLTESKYLNPMKEGSIKIKSSFKVSLWQKRYLILKKENLYCFRSHQVRNLPPEPLAVVFIITILSETGGSPRERDGGDQYALWLCQETIFEAKQKV